MTGNGVEISRLVQFAQGSAGLGMALSVLAIFFSTAILVALSALYKKTER